MTNATQTDAIAKLTRNSLIEGMCKHASNHSEKPVSNAKGLRNWFIASYYDENLTQPGGLEGFAHDLHHKAVSFRSRAHCEKLFRLLSADASGLTQRKAKVKSTGNGRMTWGRAVKGFVLYVCDHADTVKAVIEEVPDSECKLTSIKSVVGFTSNLKAQVNAQSDDPAVTLQAEICQMVGVKDAEALRDWLKSQFPEDQASALDEWNLEDHKTLLTVHQIVQDKLQQEA